MLTLAAVAARVDLAIEHLHQYNQLQPNQLRRAQDPRSMRAFCRMIREVKRPQLAGYEFRIVKLRNIKGQDIDDVLAANRRLGIGRRIRAFIGHRFTPTVTKSLSSFSDHS